MLVQMVEHGSALTASWTHLNPGVEHLQKKNSSAIDGFPKTVLEVLEPRSSVLLHWTLDISSLYNIYIHIDILLCSINLHVARVTTPHPHPTALSRNRFHGGKHLCRPLQSTKWLVEVQEKRE